MSDLHADALRILEFWFRELKPAQWFEGGRRLDGTVRAPFAELLVRARAGQLDAWKADARGRLALIILLDQFPRHIHRDTPAAFASDAQAQALCVEAISLGQDEELNVAERQFLYMPLMHAESEVLQAQSLEMFGKLRQFMDEVMDFAEAHRRQVARFGRFPYRNAALGRESTPEEQAFVASGEDRF